MTVGRTLCPLTQLPDGQSRGIDPLGEGRDTMFVVRRGQQVHAYRNACPHIDNARMAWRKDEYLNTDGTMIRCSAHGALFRIDDGECVVGPCIGQRLTPVPVAVLDDQLWLVGEYASTRRRAVRPDAKRPAPDQMRG